MLYFNETFIEKHNIFANQLIDLDKNYYDKVAELVRNVRKNVKLDWIEFSRSLDDIRYEYQDLILKTVIEYKIKVNNELVFYNVTSERNKKFKDFCNIIFDEVYYEFYPQ